MSIRTRPSHRTGHHNGAHSAGGEEAIWCGWDDCDRRGLLLHTLRVRYSTDPRRPYDVSHLFCSGRHLEYFRHAAVHYGNLPSGAKLLL